MLCVIRALVVSFLNHLEFEVQFFAAENIAEIVFPEFPQETKTGRFLIKIDQKLNSKRTPQIQQRNVRFNRLELHIRVEIEYLPARYKRIE